MDNQKQPSISIVMTVHDQAEALEQNLPAFLTVPYEGTYEVIVVDNMSADETPDVLKRMKAEYPNLYSTFLPESVIVNPSRKRLALSIGAKAAHYDYIVLADIRRVPVNTEWFLNDLRPTILKAERHSFRDYYGAWFRKQRGLYDAACVRREHVFDAIRLYDQKIRGLRLLGLRLRVWLGL